MKVIITSTGNSVDSAMDTRFGRCSYFAVYDTESRNFEFISNEAGKAQQGAGIAAAQNVLDLSADVLLTGRLGPKASQVLESSTIKTYFYESGSVTEIAHKYLDTL